MSGCKPRVRGLRLGPPDTAASVPDRFLIDTRYGDDSCRACKGYTIWKTRA
jgi:hypothetical protein